MLISVIVLGVVASLDPLRPVVFVLVLRTQLVNAIAFLAGWTLALSLLFVIVFVTFAGDISTGSGQGHRTAASVAELASGRRCSSSPRAGGVAATTRALLAGTRRRCADGSTTWTSGVRRSSAC